LTDNIRKAFIVYLISHGRPMVELLDPGIQVITEKFKNEFIDMPTEPVEQNDLEKARTELITQVKNSLNKDEKKFILSVKSKSLNGIC
jgi:hypothetical protein